MLLHVPDILSREQVAAIRQRLDDTAWADGRETVGSLGAQVKRNLQLPDQSPLKRELGETILAALARSPLFFNAALPLKILPPRFNCYVAGARMSLHQDGNERDLATYRLGGHVWAVRGSAGTGATNNVFAF